MNTPTVERIIDLASALFDTTRDDISAATTPADVPSWDSLAQLNLMVAIEDEFELELDPEVVGEILEIGALAAHVDLALAGRAP
ncbi:acyl carrier protein [Ilumatobacter coccineus]|uniref:Carrier domain-containing protein n=1 Tax=Ilumatobacter coccineus (strain NBRC 103263 / KCTC 29153 / YM16-304) TaxID=1313172 RepID=A0A6C7E5C8_ILUCY|nr:acyl carrier protein [Ilumatobacter coccineus]BAN01771.1 hypothetical protein YM304_14570 [Ilumatobacter coccineus YM16-304]